MLDAVECPPTFGVDPSRVVGLIAGGEGAFIKAVEGAEDSRTLCEEDLKKLGLTSKDIVIGLAASGRTPYVIYGLKYAASVGCKTVGIACNKGSEVGRQARLAIEPQPGGPDRLHPSEGGDLPEDGAEYDFHRKYGRRGKSL